MFDISDPTLLFGDFAIFLTPNQNYKTTVIESIANKVEGTDYKFAIRSMKFYIAKCKIPQMPTPDTAFSMMELLECRVEPRHLSLCSRQAHRK